MRPAHSKCSAKEARRASRLAMRACRGRLDEERWRRRCLSRAAPILALRAIASENPGPTANRFQFVADTVIGMRQRARTCRQRQGVPEPLGAAQAPAGYGRSCRQAFAALRPFWRVWMGEPSADDGKGAWRDTPPAR